MVYKVYWLTFLEFADAFGQQCTIMFYEGKEYSGQADMFFIKFIWLLLQQLNQ